MTEPNRDRTSAMPLIVAAVIFVAVVAIWFPYMQKGAFQEGVTRPGVNTTPALEQNSERRAGSPSESLRVDPEAPPANGEAPLETDRKPLASPSGVRGTVVDEATGEPLPFYKVTLIEAGDSPATRDRTSGADGELHWPAGPQKGELRFRMKDREKLRRSRSAPLLHRNGESEPQPFRLAVPTGPTCWIQMELPEGTGWDDFSATLQTGRALPDQQARMGGYPTPLRPPMPGLRHPKLPWVRFHLPPAFQDIGWVQLSSHDQKWKGGAWLEPLHGQVSEPLVIELTPTTSVRGHFACDTMEEQDWVVLELVGQAPPEGFGRLPTYDGHAGDDGNFQFLDVEPGAYVLKTVDKAWFPWERKVLVRPGENDLGSFPLRARRIAGRVAGTVTSTSGTYEGFCHISLSQEIGQHGAPYDQSLDWEDDGLGNWVAHFAFEDVTEGEWQLYVHCHDGFDWSDLAQVVQAPAPAITLRLDDPTVDLHITTHDADSGVPVESESVLHWRRHTEHERILGPPYTVSGQQLPLRGIQYLLFVPGYQPVSGDETQLNAHATAPGETDSMRFSLPLTPGWGSILETVDRTQGVPVPGVGVWLDGLYAGHTNDRGRIALGLPQAPRSMRLEKPGWRWVSDATFAVRSGEATLPEAAGIFWKVGFENVGR